MSYGGGFNNWQFAQVGGLITLLAAVFLLARLVRKQKGTRVPSRTFGAFISVIAASAALSTWYVVDSQPYWHTRARMNETIARTADLVGDEVIRSRSYGPITVFDSWRPQTWPPNCIQGRLYGVGTIEFDRPLTFESLESLASRYESDGFLVQRRLENFGQETPPLLVVEAVGEEESVSIALNGAENDRALYLQVDNKCLDEFEYELETTCRNCVDNFLDP